MTLGLGYIRRSDLIRGVLTVEVLSNLVSYIGVRTVVSSRPCLQRPPIPWLTQDDRVPSSHIGTHRFAETNARQEPHIGTRYSPSVTSHMFYMFLRANTDSVRYPRFSQQAQPLRTDARPLPFDASSNFHSDTPRCYIASWREGRHHVPRIPPSGWNPTSGHVMLSGYLPIYILDRPMMTRPGAAL